MSHPPSNRFRRLLRVFLVLLIIAGTAVTVINLAAAANPRGIEPSLTITLHEQPEGGYGAAEVEIADDRFAVSDRAALRSAIETKGTEEPEAVCLLRVAAGVSQKSIYQLQETLTAGQGANWKFHVVLLDEDSE